MIGTVLTLTSPIPQEEARKKKGGKKGKGASKPNILVIVGRKRGLKK